MWGRSVKKQFVNKVFLILILTGVFWSGIALGYENDVSGNAGIDEKRGQRIPLDLTFRDENGALVKLGSLVTKPAILTLNYHTCSNICPQMLGGLAAALGNMKLAAGRDYVVVTISFDEKDTPAVAKERKANYIKAIGMPFPEDAWRFLTGSRESIRLITEAVGFRFQKTSYGFIHPSVLIFLAPDGKITQYIYLEQSHYGTLAPVTFSPAIITQALMDASQGKIRTGPKNLLLLCFPNLTESQARFFSILAGIGAATLLCAIGFFIYLRRTSRTK
jgi:protein SCO1/2